MKPNFWKKSLVAGLVIVTAAMMLPTLAMVIISEKLPMGVDIKVFSTQPRTGMAVIAPIIPVLAAGRLMLGTYSGRTLKTKAGPRRTA